jgi:hypothetical protein
MISDQLIENEQAVRELFSTTDDKSTRSAAKNFLKYSGRLRLRLMRIELDRQEADMDIETETEA